MKPISPLDGMKLSLRNVGAFRGNQQVFMDISLEIRPNEFIGILGPSGSGKSTLIEILALSGRLSEGSVRFDGEKDIRQYADEYVESFGYVPQDDILYPLLTVRENLYYAARLRLTGATPEEIDTAVAEMLRRFGLEEHRDKVTENLSGGQKKRVSIAMELFRKPRLLILDEPTSGLDPAMEKSVMEDLRKIADSGTTVVCSTHVMESIELFDRVALIGKKRTNVQDTACGDLDFFETPALLKDFYGVETFAELYALLQEDPYVVFVKDRPNEHLPFFTGIGESVRDFVRDFFRKSGPSPKTTKRQIVDVFFRSLTAFRRDRFLMILSLVLPPILGYLVVLSQQDEFNIRPLLFFSIVIVLWFGMNNSVRCVVGERRIYVRETLAGLSMHGFLLGKTGFYLLLGIVQVTLLWGTVALGSANSDFMKVVWLFPVVLLASYACGLGLGLLVSTLSPTENVAIVWVPLLIMPQLLLSTVAAGNSAEDFSDFRRIRPVYYAFSEDRREPEKIDVDLERFQFLSTFCYSRPALCVLEFPIRNIRDEKMIRFEWAYFTALAAATWVALWSVFAMNRRRWRESRGRVPFFRRILRTLAF